MAPDPAAQTETRLVFHVARSADVERLRREGFSSAGTIQAWAAGVYLATDRQTAELYERLELGRERLPVLATVESPFLVEVPAGEYDAIEVMHRAIAEAYGEAAAAPISREELRRERRALADVVTSILREHGHDALEVAMGPVSPDDQRSVTVGGNQLVVFDPERVALADFDLPAPAAGAEIGW